MSSSISIGFVFEKQQSMTLLLSKILEFFKAKGELNRISYSVDENGDSWKENTIQNLTPHEVASLMVNNFWGKTNITSAILDDKIVNFDVSVSKLFKNDFGFLMEINIEQLFRVGDKKELENSTSMIIQFCKSIFDNAKYSYAFCDHEANIEYTWSEFKKLKNHIYSIVIIPENEKFVINLSSWEIDGLTNREK